MTNNASQFNPERKKYLQERIRQAKLAFNLAIVAAVLSFIVILIGVGLLPSEQVSKGTLTTAEGFLSNLAFVKLAKDANDRLDAANRSLLEHNKRDRKQN